MAHTVLEERLDRVLVGEASTQRRQGRPVRWLAQGALYALLLLLSFAFALPFLWMLSTSLKNEVQTFKIPPILIPIPPRWVNYPEALTYLPFHVYFLNTLLRYALPSAIGVLISSVLVAYGFSRIQWSGRDIFFFVCVATMIIPFQVTMVPLFIIFKKMGWINTYLPLVVPAFFANPYFIFLLRQFFLTIPLELSDAARIDGCSELGILFRIILPLSRPALTVIALFQFMWCWDDYLGPLIYLGDQSKFPVAMGIQILKANIQSVSQGPLMWPYLMAVSTAVLSPILVAFFFAQRTFIEGIALTGIKG